MRASHIFSTLAAACLIAQSTRSIFQNTKTQSKCPFQSDTENSTVYQINEIISQLSKYPFLQQHIDPSIRPYPSLNFIPCSKLCAVLERVRASNDDVISSFTLSSFDKLELARFLVRQLDAIIAHRQRSLKNLRKLYDFAEEGFQSILRDRVNTTIYTIKYEYILHPIPLLGLLRDLFSKENSVLELAKLREELYTLISNLEAK
ncbi:hypothetical protein CC78DRAFT_579041 [Lojkania enalia]|uniref:Uncharacterized protein n=1 Tax=Lojkania enalia TaxID=147567 RepID=A0A9P4KG82_9PLEO|nr:hypothetical protein CC78DRAFT_579041 [Didymosphaeria enalia]